MAVNPSAIGPKPQLELSTGLPAVGNQLFFYVAGSTGTKQNTYTDSGGLSANPNPIVLNSLGQPTNEIWWTAGLSYKVVYAPSTDTDPPTSPIWTIDNLRGINDTTVTPDQWVAGPAPTFIGTTSFSLVGDQTATFQAGRRVKTTNTSGTIYSTISASSFGAGITTVTVINDSGVLDSGLSAVSYGLISSLNSSLPLVNLSTANDTISATGYSTVPTNTMRTVKRADNTVTVDLLGSFSATSNAATKTLTGLSSFARPTTTKVFQVRVSDNGAVTPVMGVVTLDSAGVFTISPTLVGGASWTSSGTAFIDRFSFTYSLS